jgi:DNA-binding beta-propeller fold protein YncE
MSGRRQDTHAKTFLLALAFAAFAALAVAPLAQGADRIYWANDFADSISWATIDGSNQGGNLIGSGQGAPISAPNSEAIDSQSGRIYWVNYGSIDGGGTSIGWANLSGGGAGTFLNNAGAVSSPHGIAIDPTTRRLYWSNYSDNNQGGHGGEIHWVSLTAGGDATGPVHDLNTGNAHLTGPRGLAIDPAGGRIYWVNHDSATPGEQVSYANLNGSGGGDFGNTGSATVVSPDGLALDLDGGRVFWSNFNDPGSAISFANLGGGGGDLATGAATLFYPHGVAIDTVRGRIYWPNFYPDHESRFSYASLGGGNGGNLAPAGPTLFGATMFGPSQPILLKDPDGTGAPSVSGGSDVGDQLACTPGAWAGDVVASQMYQAPRSFAYQWSRDGSDVGGATAASFTPGAGGDYRCAVTARNAAGSTTQTSDPHTITTPDSGSGNSNGGGGKNDSLKPRCHGERATMLLRSGDEGTLRGTRGADVIIGSSGDDVIIGRGGNDLICGRGGDDTIKGRAGADTLRGGAGDDTLIGQRGNDVLIGGPGHDITLGGPGRDLRKP